jgi:hypothetical protein
MNPKTQKNLLYILIPSTIVVLVWVGISLYTRAISSTISPKVNTSIKEIDPQFNTDVLSSLKRRSLINGKIDIDDVATRAHKHAFYPNPNQPSPTPIQPGQHKYYPINL